MIDSRYPAMLVELFAAARQRGCVIAPIRPKLLDIEGLHEGDLDIVMNPDHADSLIAAAWDVLSASGTDFAVIRHRQEKIRLEIVDGKLEKTITLEVWLSLQVKRSPGFASRIPWRNLADFIQPDEHSLTGFIMQPDVEACYYLSHLQSKRKMMDAPVVAKRLAYYRELPGLSAETRQNLQALTSQEGIERAAALANHRLNTLGILDSRSQISFSRWIFEARLLQSRASTFVTFAGPDGVGKTTLIEHIAPALFPNAYYFKFKNTYRKSLAYHVLYFFLKKYHQFRAGKPLQKNQVDELSYSFLLIIAAMRFLMRDLINKISRKTCLADRTFSDFHILGARFHGQTLQQSKTIKHLAWLTPRPRVMIHLHAPAETIFQRKQELSMAQIQDYQRLTLASYLAQPCAVYVSINTNRSPEACLTSLQVLRSELT